MQWYRTILAWVCLNATLERVSFGLRPLLQPSAPRFQGLEDAVCSAVRGQNARDTLELLKDFSASLDEKTTTLWDAVT